MALEILDDINLEQKKAAGEDRDAQERQSRTEKKSNHVGHRPREDDISQVSMRCTGHTLRGTVLCVGL